MVLGLDNSLLEEARATNLLEPHWVNMDSLALPLDWRDTDFLPFDYGYFAFIYDSGKLQSPPASLKALVEAEDDLKILIQDPRSSTPGLGLMLWIKSVYGDQAEQAWKKLSRKVVTVTRGWSEAYGMFLEGEADMVLSYTTSPAYHMIVEEKSQYKAAAFAEGHGMQVEVAARLKNAPNPDLADQFMAFILEPGFQSVIPTGNWMYPATLLAEGLPGEFDQLALPAQALYIDAAEVAQNKKQWTNEYLRGLSK